MTHLIFEKSLIEKVTDYMKKYFDKYTLVLVGETDKKKIAMLQRNECASFDKNRWAVCLMDDNGSARHIRYVQSEYEAQNWFFHYWEMIAGKPTYERMSEIAEKCVAALDEDDHDSAMEFFEDQLDFEEREYSYFGV